MWRFHKGTGGESHHVFARESVNMVDNADSFLVIGDISDGLSLAKVEPVTVLLEVGEDLSGLKQWTIG